MGKNKVYKDKELSILTSPHITSLYNYVIARKGGGGYIACLGIGLAQLKVNFWQFLPKGR